MREGPKLPHPLGLDPGHFGTRAMMPLVTRSTLSLSYAEVPKLLDVALLPVPPLSWRPLAMHRLYFWLCATLL